MSSHYSLKDNYRKAFENFLRPALVLKNSSQRRNKSGYIPFGMMAAVVGISFAVLLITSSQSFKAFHNTAHNLDNWDTTALAAATITATESSNFLRSLKSSLENSLNNSNQNGKWIDYVDGLCGSDGSFIPYSSSQTAGGSRGIYRVANFKARRKKPIIITPIAQHDPSKENSSPDVNPAPSHNPPANDPPPVTYRDCDEPFTKFNADVFDGDNQKTSDPANENARANNIRYRRDLATNFVRNNLKHLIDHKGNLDSNINYGLEIGPSTRHRGYAVEQIIGSDYISPESNYQTNYRSIADGQNKTINNTKKASTLISDQVGRRVLVDFKNLTQGDPFESLLQEYTTGSGNLKISRRLLEALVNKNHPMYSKFMNNPTAANAFGISIVGDGQGLDFNTLPTGIKLFIDTTIPVKTDERASQSQKGYDPNMETLPVFKTSTAQLRLLSINECNPNIQSCGPTPPPPPPPKFCTIDGQKITIPPEAGFFYDNLFAPNGYCVCADENPSKAFCEEDATDPINPGTPNECDSEAPLMCNGEEAKGTLKIQIEKLNDDVYDIAYDKDSEHELGTELNPIYIIRRKGKEDGDFFGFYVAMFKDDNGHIIYQHGSGFDFDPDTVTIDPETGEEIRSSNYKFNDGSTKNSDTTVSNLDEYTGSEPITIASYPACSDSVITLPTFTRAKKRFGFVSGIDDIVINGESGQINIPAGAYVIGTLDSGVTHNGQDKNYPTNLDAYNSFKFYDSETGQFLGEAKPKDIKDGKVVYQGSQESVGHQLALDIKDYSSRNGLGLDGTRGIYGENFAGQFDTGALFSDVCDPVGSSLAFANILKDLNVTIISGVEDNRGGDFDKFINNNGGTTSTPVTTDGDQDVIDNILTPAQNEELEALKEAQETLVGAKKDADDKADDLRQAVEDLNPITGSNNTQVNSDRDQASRGGDSDNDGVYELGYYDYELIRVINDQLIPCYNDAVLAVSRGNNFNVETECVAKFSQGIGSGINSPLTEKRIIEIMSDPNHPDHQMYKDLVDKMSDKRYGKNL